MYLTTTNTSSFCSFERVSTLMQLARKWRVGRLGWWEGVGVGVVGRGGGRQIAYVPVLCFIAPANAT